jgi:hypothetical protein
LAALALAVLFVLTLGPALVSGEEVARSLGVFVSSAIAGILAAAIVGWVVIRPRHHPGQP